MYLQFNNSRYFYATNVQGDVTALVHTSGTAVVEYTYDAWGNFLQKSNTKYINNNPLRYRGYVYDPETELYYCQSRYYDPKIGRFLNADGLVSTGQGLLGNNMFAYCNNNPVMYEDASGCSLKPSTTYINDGAGGTPGPVGMFSSEDWKNLQDIFNYEDEIVRFSAIEESEEVAAGTKTASALSGSADLFSIGADGLTIVSFDFSVIKLDISNGFRTFSFFNLGNVSASAGIGTIPYVEAMASVWSPSISYQIGDKTITLTIHFGAVGAGYRVSKDSFSISWAKGIGASFSIS